MRAFFLIASIASLFGSEVNASSPCNIAGFQDEIGKVLSKEINAGLQESLSKAGINWDKSSLKIEVKDADAAFRNPNDNNFQDYVWFRVKGTLQTASGQELQVVSYLDDHQTEFYYSYNTELKNDGFNSDGSPVNAECWVNPWPNMSIQILNKKYKKEVGRLKTRPIFVYSVK